MVCKILAVALMATFLLLAPPLEGYDLSNFWCETCDCLPPQGLSQLDSGWELHNEVIKRMELGPSSVCYCVCGKLLGENCNTRYDCQDGLFCSDRSTTNGPGYCRTKCNKDPKFKECHLYERCVGTRDGSPFCERMTKQCSPDIYFPVCASDGNRNVTFTNRCFMELHNIELRDANIPEYKHQVKGACPGDTGSVIGAPHLTILS